MTAWQVTLTLLAAAAVLAAYDRVRDLVTGRRHRSTLARLSVAAVRAYQRWISPLRPPTCRFTPSCSAYAVEALERFGAVRGGWLTARRLLRCGPWHPGGHDPVQTAVGRRGDPGHVKSLSPRRPRPISRPAPPSTRSDAATSTPTGAPRC